MQPTNPPPPTEQEQSPDCRNVHLRQIDSQVRVHGRRCATSSGRKARPAWVVPSLSSILRNQLARRLPLGPRLAPQTTPRVEGCRRGLAGRAAARLPIDRRPSRAPGRRPPAPAATPHRRLPTRCHERRNGWAPLARRPGRLRRPCPRGRRQAADQISAPPVPSTCPMHRSATVTDSQQRSVAALTELRERLLATARQCFPRSCSAPALDPLCCSARRRANERRAMATVVLLNPLYSCWLGAARRTLELGPDGDVAAAEIPGFEA
jgi:hypothetical protein